MWPPGTWHSHRNLPTSITAVVLLVIHHTELSGGNSMNGILGMYHIGFPIHHLHRGMVPLWGVPYLESDVLRQLPNGEKMEIMHSEVRTIGRGRVIAEATYRMFCSTSFFTTNQGPPPNPMPLR